MSSFQKTIKYIAIAFAIFLAIAIISGIANVVFSVVTAVSGGVFHNNSSSNTVDYTDTFSDVKSLYIDNATGRLNIKVGDSFKVEAENVSENFEAKVDNGTLNVTDTDVKFNFLWFNFNDSTNPNSKITVYLPADFIAEEAKINSGAGTVTVEGLQTDYLMISAGAGNISGSNITANEVKVDGGVGSTTLRNVNFTDADFNCGVGSLEVDGVLLGDNKIDCGVGEVNLDLTGNADDYDLDIDSGIGSIRLNGEKISDEYKTNKDAVNSIKVDGGVGDVRINID